MAVSALLLAAAPGLRAQDTLEATLSADVVSHYVWRGMDYAHASVQPSLELSWKGFSVSAWGSAPLVRTTDLHELDLSACYSIGGLTLGVMDYWCDSPDPRYFCYVPEETGHVWEAFVKYDFGFLNVSWQTNFAGNDFTEAGRRAYSSYFELGVPFQLGGLDWEAVAGVVPFATDYYGTPGFAVTNVGVKATREIRFSDRFSLPVFGQLVANPYARHLYFVFGLTLR